MNPIKSNENYAAHPFMDLVIFSSIMFDWLHGNVLIPKKEHEINLGMFKLPSGYLT